jgi:hypothetical protein
MEPADITPEHRYVVHDASAGPQQTSDWCICILCSKIMGLSDISHMQDELHIARMHKDTSGVAKYIFNIPRPLYRDTLRQYSSDYMPTPEELNAAFQYYQNNQPFMHGAAMRPLNPQYRFNTNTLMHERVDAEMAAIGIGSVGAVGGTSPVAGPSALNNPTTDWVTIHGDDPVRAQERLNEELDRQMMEFVIKESIEEQNRQSAQGAPPAEVEQAAIREFYKNPVVEKPEDNIEEHYDEWALMESVDDVDGEDGARESVSDIDSD